MIALVIVIFAFIAVSLISMKIGAILGARVTCEYLFNSKELGVVSKSQLHKILDNQLKKYKYSCMNVHFKHNR